MTFDSVSPHGARIWNAVQERLGGPEFAFIEMEVREESARYGEPFLNRARLGQGTFRVLVTEAYDRQCAITGESTLPVLEAAHIRPFAAEGPNHPSNGLLLRSDFHKLFDFGLVTVTPSFHVEVSPRIREKYYNGVAYYRLHGKKMKVFPTKPGEVPDRLQLQWHNENVYVS